MSASLLPAGARDRLRDVAVSETGFVFDPFTGATYSVNATGRVLLEGLVAGRDREGLVALLRERFAVRDGKSRPLDLARDVDDFLGELRRNDLLPDGSTP